MDRKYRLRMIGQRKPQLFNLGFEATENELRKSQLFIKMIREGLDVDSARIISDNPDALDIHPENIISAYRSLTSLCDLPNEASAHIASSYGIFRDDLQGLIQVAEKFVRYHQEENHSELEAAEKAIF